MRVFRVISMAAVCALLVPTVSPAQPGGPPFEAAAGGACYGLNLDPLPGLATCEHAESIDGTTGAADLALAVSSRGQGYLPGFGSGESIASFTDESFTLAGPAKKVVVTATFEVDSASMEVVGRLGGLLTTAQGYVSAATNVSIANGSCFSCSGSQWQEIVGSISDVSSVEHETYTVSVTLEPFTDDTIPAGDVRLNLHFIASVSLGPQSVGIGSIEAALTGRLIGFSVNVTPAE